MTLVSACDGGSRCHYDALTKVRACIFIHETAGNALRDVLEPSSMPLRQVGQDHSPDMSRYDHYVVTSPVASHAEIFKNHLTYVGLKKSLVEGEGLNLDKNAVNTALLSS